MNGLNFLFFLFIEILICQANNYPQPIDKCPEIQVAENFDSTKFYKGQWYMLSLFGWVSQSAGTCIRIEYMTKESSNEVETIYFEKTQGKMNNATLKWNMAKPGQLSYNVRRDDAGIQTSAKVINF